MYLIKIDILRLFQKGGGGLDNSTVIALARSERPEFSENPRSEGRKRAEF